eukprot:45697_1
MMYNPGIVFPGQQQLANQSFQQPTGQMYQQPGGQMYQQPGSQMYQQPGGQLFQQPGGQPYQQVGGQPYQQPNAPQVYQHGVPAPSIVQPTGIIGGMQYDQYGAGPVLADPSVTGQGDTGVLPTGSVPAVVDVPAVSEVSAAKPSDVEATPADQQDSATTNAAPYGGPASAKSSSSQAQSAATVSSPQRPSDSQRGKPSRYGSSRPEPEGTASIQQPAMDYRQPPLGGKAVPAALRDVMPARPYRSLSPRGRIAIHARSRSPIRSARGRVLVRRSRSPPRQLLYPESGGRRCLSPPSRRGGRRPGRSPPPRSPLMRPRRRPLQPGGRSRSPPSAGRPRGGARGPRGGRGGRPTRRGARAGRPRSGRGRPRGGPRGGRGGRGGRRGAGRGGRR